MARGAKVRFNLRVCCSARSDPTPATDELLTLRWRPVRRGEAETFLEIGDDLLQRDRSAQGADASLWARVFADMRDGKGV